MIVVDTSVLSHVYRRRTRPTPLPPLAARFAALVQDDAPIVIPGVVLQEILSGVKTDRELRRLEEVLSGFPLLLASRETHVRAARVRTACRARGVAAASIDCLIAAHALSAEAELMTLDDDFEPMRKIVGLRLLQR